MIWTTETVLMGKDSKGNPVAFWARNTGHKMDLMYLAKQVKITDVEKFGNDMYLNNCAENLSLKITKKDEKNTIQD